MFGSGFSCKKGLFKCYTDFGWRSFIHLGGIVTWMHLLDHCLVSEDEERFQQGWLVTCVLLISEGVLGAKARIKVSTKFYLSYYCRMNKNHSPLYGYVLREESVSRNYSWNESDEFLQLTDKACNTDPYVSLTLLHAVVRWKELVDRVRVPCVMCRLPPGVEHGTKSGDVLCWDFALLVVMEFCLTGARADFLLSWESQFTVESGGGVMFAGLVLFIKRKNIRAGKPSRADWFTMFIERKNIRAGKPSWENWFTIFIERKNTRAGKPSRADWFTMFYSKRQIAKSLITLAYNWKRNIKNMKKRYHKHEGTLRKSWECWSI